MITLQKVQFSYQKNTALFSSLNLEIEAGKIYGLLGKNGAGKTTLLKIISGLVNYHKGLCNVLGDQPFKRKTQFLEQVFIVPEIIYTPRCSISSYLKRYSGFYPGFSELAIKEHLMNFELETDMHLSHLSYGQQKKFMLAFAMASGCRLILLDEPTNGLDIPSKSIFRKLVASTLTDEKTFIISTHQVRDLNMLIDNVIILDKGNIRLNTSIQSITEEFAFLTLPHNSDQQPIYSEQHLDGLKSIIKNESHLETAVDLELFFNAVVFNKIYSIS